MSAGALALAAAGVALAGGLAFAQQSSGLRGSVLEENVNELLGLYPPRAGTGTQSAQAADADEETGLTAGSYTPASTGAVADDDTTLSDPSATQPAAQSALDDLPNRVPGTSVQTAADRVVRQPTGVATPREPTTAAAEEEETDTATIPAGRVDALDEERNARATTDNIRTGAVEGLARTPKENPYAPLGIRTGTFVVTPTLEQGVGWTSNASSSPGGRQSVFSETALRLNAVSDWGRHSASVRADGTYRKSLSGADIDEIEGGVDGELRLDLADQWAARLAAGYRVRPESASSPTAIEGSASQPLRHAFTGSAGLSRDIGKLRLGVTGDVARDIYEDAELSDGSLLSQADRNATLATATVRAGYEVSPALRPFVEAEIGRRFHDRKVDGQGYARSADRYGLRAGVELDLQEKLTGEFSAGWLTERPDDERLADIAGLSMAGNLAWSPVRGTIVELNGSTTVESATAAGESGSLLYSGSLALRRELRPDLTGRALVGLDWRDYAGSDGHDLIMRGELGLTWWLNRYAGITGRAHHEIQRSNIADRDYDSTGVYLGMTFQR